MSVIGMLVGITAKLFRVDDDFRNSAESNVLASMWKLEHYLDTLVETASILPPEEAVKSPSKYIPELNRFRQLQSVIEDVGSPLARLSLYRRLLGFMQIGILAHVIFLILWIVLSISLGESWNKTKFLAWMFGIPLAATIGIGIALAWLRSILSK